MAQCARYKGSLSWPFALEIFHRGLLATPGNSDTGNGWVSSFEYFHQICLWRVRESAVDKLLDGLRLGPLVDHLVCGGCGGWSFEQIATPPFIGCSDLTPAAPQRCRTPNKIFAASNAIKG